MSRFIVAAVPASLGKRLRHTLKQSEDVLHPFPVRPLPTDPHELFALAEVPEPPEVVVLGPDAPLAKTLELSARLDEQYPWISVVLVADPGPDLWADAMRAGVREILAPDADEADVRTVADRASQTALDRRQAGVPPGERGGKGRVIAVVSPKGGTGKTTVATNLAVGLASVAPMSTVLVDLDVQFGDVASALQMQTEHSVAEAVHGPASTDLMVLKSYLGLHPHGFYVVCAPDSPAVGDSITGEEVSRLLDQLASQFAYVIVDTAPGLGEHALAAFEQATDAILMCGMDVPSVLGLRKELAVLGELGLMPGSRHTVLNFAHRQNGLSVRDIEATTGVPVDIVLPHSRAVPLSTNRGVPLLQDGTRDPVTKGLRELVERFDPASKTARKALRAHRGTVVR